MEARVEWPHFAGIFKCILLDGNLFTLTDNGLVLIRRQAIILTNDGLFTNIMSFGLNESVHISSFNKTFWNYSLHFHYFYKRWVQWNHSNYYLMINNRSQYPQSRLSADIGLKWFSLSWRKFLWRLIMNFQFIFKIICWCLMSNNIKTKCKSQTGINKTFFLYRTHHFCGWFLLYN